MGRWAGGCFLQAGGGGRACLPASLFSRLCHPLSPPACCLQLAEIYLHAKGGMQRGTYIPAAMYSCGPHKAGPQLEKTTTHIAAVA